MTARSKKKIQIKDLTGKEVISKKEMKTVLGGAAAVCKCDTFAGARDTYYDVNKPGIRSTILTPQ
jgi:natural product precursor